MGEFSTAVKIVPYTWLNMTADGLSGMTILSCLFMKIPQITQLRKCGTARGIYVQPILLEIIGYTITTLYNFCNQFGVLTYLEYPIILVQLYALIYYVLKFKRQLNFFTLPIYVGIYSSIALAFVFELLPKKLLHFMVPFCAPLSGFAKVTYMYMMVSDGHADSVSLTTWIISVATNTARIFTVYVDSADFTLIVTFIVSSSLSAGVLALVIYYHYFNLDFSNTRNRRRTSQTPKDFFPLRLN